MSKKMAEIWSQANCHFCDMAKNILASKGYTITERKIGVNVTRDDFLTAHPGARTVPQIWLNGEIVPGGYAGLKAMLDD